MEDPEKERIKGMYGNIIDVFRYNVRDASKCRKFNYRDGIEIW